MIIKSYEANKSNLEGRSIILLYGKNEGFINEVIQDYFINNFEGEIIKYDENEVLNNNEVIIGEIHAGCQILKILADTVGKGLRRHAFVCRGFLNFLAMFVGTGEKHHLEAI